jgi:hypothetical protein
MNFWVMAACGLVGAWATGVVVLLSSIHTELQAIKSELSRR